ncbi:MAG: hypothetical protein M1812_002603 [Candelaria pacifica]|nr:MAG: hypothetical protein M1812_002603 [Candelaria pacifica]
MGPPTAPGTSAATARKAAPSTDHSMSGQPTASTDERDGSYATSRLGHDGNRSMANANVAFGPRGSSLAPSIQHPGGLNPEMRSTMASRSGTPKPDSSRTIGLDPSLLDQQTSSEQRLAEYRERISKETKIKIGSENLLDALNSKNAKQTKDQRLRVESELNSSNRKLAQLKSQLEEEVQRAKLSRSPSRSRLSRLFRGNPLRSPSRNQSVTSPYQEQEGETESSTFVLAEILQALERENMQPDYYVERANSLVELFKRHTTLKYDLAWSVFGLRIQMMLLSDNREVIAAGYRVVRYAITDRKSLQTIRRLQTDYLIILSLIKESKASVEREQALKLIRAFLDVKGGVGEISRAVVRTIVSVAEHSEDRLRSICVLTLAEILMRDPPLLVAAGGVGPLTEALSDANYAASESLVNVFLHLLDMPYTRRLLRPGCELEIVFSPFTDSLSTHGHDQRLKANAKVIAALLKTWPGLITLSMYEFRALRSLLTSLYVPSPSTRDLIFELLFDVLCIKPPSWSSSFLAGRRLTTYGRVAHLRTEAPTSSPASASPDSSDRKDLVEHFTALLLAVLLETGLLKALLYVLKNELDPALKRKATLLLSEVLKLASHLLPSTWSSTLQLLPELFVSAAKFGIEERYIATSAIYQVDSVNRTLYRSGLDTTLPTMQYEAEGERSRATSESDPAKSKFSVQMDEAHFRSLLLESQVLNSVNHTKWKWDIIQQIIEGPLLNPKRLDEAIRASKFVKRLIAFYRPFKYRFSEVRNTKPNQRYVRAGCALMRTLLQNSEGVKYLVENKLLRQIAECLAQLDRVRAYGLGICFSDRVPFVPFSADE